MQQLQNFKQKVNMKELNDNENKNLIKSLNNQHDDQNNKEKDSEDDEEESNQKKEKEEQKEVKVYVPIPINDPVGSDGRVLKSILPLDYIVVGSGEEGGNNESGKGRMGEKDRNKIVLRNFIQLKRDPKIQVGNCSYFP